MLESKKIDALLSAGPDFWEQWANQPVLTIESRTNGEEQSRLAVQRLHYVLARWKKHIKEVRFVRSQLPSHFDDPFAVEEPDAASGSAAERNILGTLIRIFPFMLVMWSLAGALYPAIDVCAGEKERGTMETLLISPAGREEIVWGKFLTIWVFSAGTALLNVLSMALTTWAFAAQLPQVGLTAGGLIWCVLLLLPLSAFFSTVCLASGAYAQKLQGRAILSDAVVSGDHAADLFGAGARRGSSMPFTAWCRWYREWPCRNAASLDVGAPADA